MLLVASQAAAAVTVSQATAQAIGGNLLTTGSCASTNDSTVAAPGTRIPTGAGCTAGGPASNSGALLAASVVVQTSNANPNSTSAACAGVTGPGGGAIQVGPAGPCTGVSAGTSAGVNLISNLVTADAVFATCSAALGSTPTGTSTLVSAGLGTNATILAALNGLGITGAGALPVNPGPNTTINLALAGVNIITLILNKQDTTTVPGQISVTALDLTLLSGGITAIQNVPVLGPLLLGLLGLTAANGGLHVTIGNVTCGPSAAVAVIPTLPVKAIPIAGAVALLAGGVAYLGRRRLFAGFRG